MVPNVSQLLTKTKTFKLNQSLTCADFGIYQCAGVANGLLKTLRTQLKKQAKMTQYRYLS